MGLAAAVIVAAGRGLRAGGPVAKQYRELAGQPVVRHSLTRFSQHPAIDLVQSVIHPQDQALFDNSATGLTLLAPVSGGATRQESVRAGLEALASHKPEVVLIHDAARAFASAALLDRAVAAARATGAAVPALPVVDTIKTVDAGNRITATLERAALRMIQTPQAFRFDAILDAHRRAAKAGRSDFTDDAAVAEWAGLTVSVFDGDPANLKLTNPEDFARVAHEQTQPLTDIRTGSGFDVHEFGPGDYATICGLRVPHDRGVVGHSDADVGLHALTDALLGSIADGDIGAHFPPSDERWRGAASDQFLAFAAERVRARGGRIALLDVTLLCEAPRIGPHRDAMRARIAEIVGIDVSRVGGV
ncbi:MAG: 2-C-methyl-D-erythritol 4-phosphate cytidylyltransferase [Rhizobiales bacterium]|nr:2-C-methyl-D-erythritol 4-phosphate cytidylyltransferase [Hyphomicrobiales bacterium]